MELKQFVKEALISIIDGVKDANSEHNRFRIIGVKRNESGIDGNMVDFDVSVVAEKKSEGKVGGNVGVTFLNVVSADIDSKLNQSDSKQNVNSLKFKVWISESDLN